LLSSETVSALHDRTFRLFVALILTADDYGLVEIGYGPIREATALLDGWNRELVAKMLAELTDSGLILPYESGGKRYAALAKWKSHINMRSPRCPIPSWGMTHIVGVYGFKDAKTRIDSSHHFKHLGLCSGPPVGNEYTPSGAAVHHQWGTSTPPVNEKVRGKREKIKEKTRLSENLTARWVCPPDVDPAAWRDWMAVRRKKKAATSERALTSVLAKLEQARTMGINPSSLVEKSADHGWIDLYLPDNRNGSASRPVPQHAPQQSMSMWDTSGALDQDGNQVAIVNKSQV
jgi:hypothetical protein